jgi:hypothetical protein
MMGGGQCRKARKEDIHLNIKVRAMLDEETKGRKCERLKLMLHSVVREQYEQKQIFKLL